MIYLLRIDRQSERPLRIPPLGWPDPRSVRVSELAVSRVIRQCTYKSRR